MTTLVLEHEATVRIQHISARYQSFYIFDCLFFYLYQLQALNGGALYITNSKLHNIDIESTMFVSCSSSQTGGAYFFDNNENLVSSFANTIFKGNKAPNGYNGFSSSITKYNRTSCNYLEINFVSSQCLCSNAIFADFSVIHHNETHQNEYQAGISNFVISLYSNCLFKNITSELSAFFLDSSNISFQNVQFVSFKSQQSLVYQRSQYQYASFSNCYFSQTPILDCLTSFIDFQNCKFEDSNYTLINTTHFLKFHECQFETTEDIRLIEQNLYIESNPYTISLYNSNIYQSIEYRPSCNDISISHCIFSNYISKQPGFVLYVATKSININIDNCYFDSISTQITGNYYAANIVIKCSSTNISICSCCQTSCKSSNAGLMVCLGYETSYISINTMTISENLVDDGMIQNYAIVLEPLLIKSCNFSHNYAFQHAILITKYNIEMLYSTIFYNQIDSFNPNQGCLMQIQASIDMISTNLVFNIQNPNNNNESKGIIAYYGLFIGCVMYGNSIDFLLKIKHLWLHNCIIDHFAYQYGNQSLENNTYISSLTYLPQNHMQISQCKNVIIQPKSYTLFIILGVVSVCLVIIFSLTIYFIIKRKKVKKAEHSILLDKAIIEEFG